MFRWCDLRTIFAGEPPTSLVGELICLVRHKTGCFTFEKRLPFDKGKPGECKTEQRSLLGLNQ